MVTNITSLTGNGLKDWLIQRITAIYFAVYSLGILGFIICHPDLEYSQWHHFFRCSVVQVATVIALLALLLHAWIGIWTVTTDYLKCTWLRIAVQMLVLLLLLSEFMWGLMILWGQ